MYKDDINKFNGTDSPSCLLKVNAAPVSTTDPILHYPVSLKGVDNPTTIIIHKMLSSTIPLAPSNDSHTNIILFSYSIHWVDLL